MSSRPDSPRRPATDLTSGPVMRTLIVFALPTLLSNVLQSLNASINSVWVGRMIGEQGLAATANANIVMFLIFAGVFGFSMATTVRVGQSFGARDVDAARRTFGTGIGFCTLLSVGIAALGWIFAPQLLTLLTVPDASRALALAYLRVVFLVMPGMTITIMIAMSLRGAGDSRTPLYFMILTAVLDVALNPLLIAGIGPFPRMGIAGSATATAIATVAGLAAMIVYLYARDLPLRLRGHELRYLVPRREELGYIVRKGLPMGAQMLLVSSAGIIMVGLVNREGLIPSAAYGASLQLWNYLQMPAMAIGAAVSAMAAQAIGAQLEPRIAAITRAGVISNLVLTGLLAAVLLAFDRAALVLFLGPESPAVPLARHLQWIASWSFILFGVTIVLFGTMRAYGRVLAPLVVLGITLIPVRLGFYYLAYPRLGMDAIWWSFVLGSLTSMVLAYVAYARMKRETFGTSEPDLAAEQARCDGDQAGRMKPAI